MTYLCHAFETDVIGRLAQLVQSVCLTSRGSGVRIPQRPHQWHLAQDQRLRALSSAGSERLPYKQRVGGSNPSAPTPKDAVQRDGHLAQLVQSTCLTDKGSAVRIRQCPPQRSNHGTKSIGRLAQLVQSVCLTSRGSGVRIPQRPPSDRCIAGTTTITTAVNTMFGCRFSCITPLLTMMQRDVSWICHCDSTGWRNGGSDGIKS